MISAFISMFRLYRIRSAIVLLLLGGPCLNFAWAAAISIRSLPLQVDSKGDWHLPAGEYRGQFVINEPLTLICDVGAIFNGEGEGNGLTIAAENVTVQGCTLNNWGKNLTKLNAAIFIQQKASNAKIKANQMNGVASGIWVDATHNVSLLDNRIEGDKTIRSQDRGNAIHLYAVSGAKVVGNQVRYARDGIYIDTSNDNILENNLLEDLRYGIHYMFSHDNLVIKNITRRTRTGYALMQSRNLVVIGNRSEQDQNYGMLMNYITYSTIRDNIIIGVRDGGKGDGMIPGSEGKALFIYNSLFNIINHNRFEQSSLGIHMTAGSEDNSISANSFIKNQQQVKYVATRRQEWSQKGRGNYWSDYLGWDRNGNGLGDIPYEPNDNVDRLIWLYPQVRLLMNSPGIEVLRWAQRAFPIIKSPGVQDSHPLMRPLAILLCIDASEAFS